MTWKDFLIVGLVQVVLVALGLIYMQRAYPPMMEYVNAVGGQLARQVAPLEERIGRLERSAGGGTGQLVPAPVPGRGRQ